MAHATIEGIADSELPLTDRLAIINRVRDVRIANWSIMQSLHHCQSMDTLSAAILAGRMCCIVTPRIGDEIEVLFTTHFSALDPIWDFVYFEFTEE